MLFFNFNSLGFFFVKATETLLGEMIDVQFDEKPVHGLKNLIRRWISLHEDSWILVFQKTIGRLLQDSRRAEFLLPLFLQVLNMEIKPFTINPFKKGPVSYAILFGFCH